MEIYFVSLLQGDVGLKQVNDRRWVMINQIVHGDCLEVMKEIEDKSIDAIITDPPYNIAKPNNFHTMGRAGIDFGEWDKGFDLFSWIEDAYRVLRNGGTLFLFNAWKNVGEIAKHAEGKGFEIKDMIRWRKLNPMPRNRDRRYITDFEVAIWLVKPKAKWTFNRLSGTYDRCEYEYPITAGNEKVGHPTQKPVALMEEIINRHTNKEDLVLDPFIGSGTTAIACLNTGRFFIGIEQDEHYCNIARQRIAEMNQDEWEEFKNITNTTSDLFL